MSELFDKSIRTLELPRGAGTAGGPGRQRRGQGPLPAADTGDGGGGGPPASGSDRRGPGHDRSAGQPLLFRGQAGGGGTGPGGPGRQPEHPRAADHCRAPHRRPAGAGVLQRGRPEKTVIDHLFLSLHGNRYLEDRIKNSILDEDEIADSASPELADIRRHMRQAASKSRQMLQRIISSPSYAKVLAGGHHHPAGRPLRGAGEGGAQGGPAGTGPRHLLLRRHPLCGTHGRGPGQQRAQGTGGQGEEGDRADPGGALRRGGGPSGGHPLGLRRPGRIWT